MRDPVVQGKEVLLGAANVTVLPGPVEPSMCIMRLLASPGYAVTSTTTLLVRLLLLLLRQSFVTQRETCVLFRALLAPGPL